MQIDILITWLGLVAIVLGMLVWYATPAAWPGAAVLILWGLLR